ncbi:MAG: hypothetical protein ACOYVF_12995 [Candidatus Zixiibacteriota bacterium]
MPFCPKCRYEYEAGVFVCPDCDERLVALLPDDENESDDYDQYDNWVQLARLSSSQSADMVEEVLQEKNIPVVIYSGTGHFGIVGQMGPSSPRPIGGGYSVFVPEEFVSDADQEASIVLGEEWEKAKLFDIEKE